MIHITVIGDSITQGHWETTPPSYSVAHTDTYPAKLAQRLNSGAVTYSTFSPFAYANQAEAAKRVIAGDEYTCWAAGIGGQKTDQMLARWDIDVMGHQTDVCVIMAGVNDLANGVTAQTACDNIETMLDLCEASNIKPIICKLTPWTRGTTQNKDDADALNALLVTLAATRGFELVDTFTPLAKTDGSRNIKDAYNADGIHLSPAGYQAVADTFDLSSFDVAPSFDLDVTLNMPDTSFDLDVILHSSSSQTMEWQTMSDNGLDFSSTLEANARCALLNEMAYVVPGIGGEFATSRAGLNVTADSGQGSIYGRFIANDLPSTITVNASTSGYIVVRLDLTKGAGLEASLLAVPSVLSNDMRSNGKVADLILASYVSTASSVTLVDLRKWPTAPGTRAGSLSSGVLTAGVVKNITIPIYPSFPLGTKVIPTLAIAGQNPQTFAMGIVEVTHSELKISVRNEVYSTGATIYWTATAAH